MENKKKQRIRGTLPEAKHIKYNPEQEITVSWSRLV